MTLSDVCTKISDCPHSAIEDTEYRKRCAAP